MSITGWPRRSHYFVNDTLSQFVHILDNPLLKNAVYVVIDRVDVWTMSDGDGGMKFSGMRLSRSTVSNYSCAR